MNTTRTSVVVLAYGPEPWLGECIGSALRADGVTEVVLVDNGAPDAIRGLRAAHGLGHDPRLRVLRPPENLGYTGGCNTGARHATGDVLVFLNSDAYLERDTVTHLAAALGRSDVGLVTSQLRLAERPDTVNSVGNPVQFLSFSWAGHYGEPVTAHSVRREVASVSGACFAVKRKTWLRLGGFDDRYFAYGEDLDLSIRAWQRGLSVVYEPQAVAYHHWERGRNVSKPYLRERNRLVNALTLYDRRTTVLILPALVAVEGGVTLTALRGGWLRTKVETWQYLLRHRRQISARRRTVQAGRTVRDADLHHLIRGPVDPPPDAGISVPGVANRFLATYWAWVGRRIGAAPATRRSGDLPDRGPGAS